MSGAKQVGIVAAQIYFPNCFIDQSDLEQHDKVSGLALTEKFKFGQIECLIKKFEILWGYVTSIFRAEMSNCHISHKNVTMDCNISRII